MIKIKRAYETAAPEDGVRVLVDRLWPRGVSKERAAIDWWAKDVAPSADLRKWFGHEAVKFEEFKERYADEVRGNPDLEKLAEMAETQTVTLVYGAKDQVRNQAAVLAELLAGRPHTTDS
ncbi:MAG: DUF488 family protein [Trueperaceae bacterium]|nr:DUF488 family protein [Trueperaceae bacterium]